MPSKNINFFKRELFMSSLFNFEKRLKFSKNNAKLKYFVNFLYFIFNKFKFKIIKLILLKIGNSY